MMINRILILFFAATLLLFCSGCFTSGIYTFMESRFTSSKTWTLTPEEIETHVENVRTEYTSPEELTVHSTGWQKIAYLRFDWATRGPFSWEQHIVLPLTRLPDEQTHRLVFEIEVDPREERRFYKTESGLWSMQEGQSHTIHPDDISHLSEPYIGGGYGPGGCLIIPLEVSETKEDGMGRRLRVEGYEAYQVHFPGYTTEEYTESVVNMILPCCLLPVTIAIDAATFPFQAYLYLCICSGLSDA